MIHHIPISIVLCSTILNENSFRAFEKESHLENQRYVVRIWPITIFYCHFFIYQLIEVDDKSEEESNLQVSINA